MAHFSVWIGFDPREVDAFAVARSSIRRRSTMPIPIRSMVLSDLRARGFYDREHTRVDGKLWDVISNAPMGTEFAISRFLVSALAGRQGWALFLDADMLMRTNVVRLLDEVDPSKAVMVVKHCYEPSGDTKMDGQTQSCYYRKNWSSFMLFNLEHPAVRALTPERVNTMRGLDLHQFAWLEDDQIGELGAEWNYLVGHTQGVDNPKCVHFTEGVPSMPGYENCEYADEWREELVRWAI